jgi:hypothetical protein
MLGAPQARNPNNFDAGNTPNRYFPFEMAFVLIGPNSGPRSHTRSASAAHNARHGRHSWGWHDGAQVRVRKRFEWKLKHHNVWGIC